MDLETKCHFCKGTKKLENQESCPFCAGLGSETTIAPPAKYFSAVDVFECIDLSEYAALNDQKREVVRLMLGAGYVYMKGNATARNKLGNYFPAGTATNAALSALIGETL